MSADRRWQIGSQGSRLWPLAREDGRERWKSLSRWIVGFVCLGAALCGSLSCVGDWLRKAKAPPRAPAIDPDLGTLTQADVCVLARDALVRFVEEFHIPPTRRYYLSSRGTMVDVARDRQPPGGELEADFDTRLELGAEVFGDYSSLPPAVKAVVLPRYDPAAKRRGALPLCVGELAYSKTQRKVQVTLQSTLTPSMAYSFLYHVQKDGRLVFLGSHCTGCSSPGGRLIDTLEGFRRHDAPPDGASAD